MKNITEAQIAEIFFGHVIEKVEKAWPEIYKQLKKRFSKERKFEIENEDDAKMDLVFAVIALEIQVLKNLFPDRAERIYHRALNSIGLPEKRERIKRKIDLYQDKFYQSTEQYTKNKYYSPLEEVAVQLLHDWLKDDITQFYVLDTEVVDPFLAGMLSLVLPALVGFWKKIKDNFTIAED